MAKPMTAEDVLDVARGYQEACVLAAAAELDVFSKLSAQPMDSWRLAEQMGADPRAVTILLDALAAMGLLAKHGQG